MQRRRGFYLRLFEADGLDPNASGLIFWSPEGLEDAKPEQIVDKALSYGPIAL